MASRAPIILSSPDPTHRSTYYILLPFVGYMLLYNYK